MPFGPRLDRPSAVGDEGRPRETSLGISAVTVVGLALAAGFALGSPAFVTGFALVAGLSTAGIALLDRDSLGEKVVGHLCFLPGATGLGLLVVDSPGGGLLLNAGFVLALVGTASTWADVATDEKLESALTQGLLSYVFGLVWIVLGIIALAAVFLLWELLTGLGFGANPTAAAIGLFVVVGVVAAALRITSRAVPVVQLAPRDRREGVRQRFGRVKRTLSIAALVSFAIAVVFTVLLATGVPTIGLIPGTGLVLGALTSVFVLGPLLAVVAVAVFAAGVAVGVRQVTQQFGEEKTRNVAAGIAGAGYLVVLLFGAVPQLAGLLIFAPVVFVGIVFLAPIAVLVAVGAALVAVRTGLFPDRAGGPALASAGLVVAAVGADNAGLPAPLVFGCVAGALVVWDVGSFGLGLTAELGHRPSTRRLELYHGVFGVAVGLLAVLVASGLEVLRTSAAAGGHTTAMTVAVVGALVLAALLRG